MYSYWDLSQYRVSSAIKDPFPSFRTSRGSHPAVGVYVPTEILKYNPGRPVDPVVAGAAVRGRRTAQPAAPGDRTRTPTPSTTPSPQHAEEEEGRTQEDQASPEEDHQEGTVPCSALTPAPDVSPCQQGQRLARSSQSYSIHCTLPASTCHKCYGLHSAYRLLCHACALA
jgi:hypothetical protein